MQYPPSVLYSPQVRLRRSIPEDAPAIFGATSDPVITKFMEWPRHVSVDETQEFFNGCEERWGSGSEYHWIIEIPDTYETAGCIALRVRDHDADFGYFLFHKYWGKGIALAATQLVLEWVKSQLQITRIWASTDYDNARSIKTLQRLGLKRERLLNGVAVRPNISSDPRDTIIFSLEREDF